MTARKAVVLFIVRALDPVLEFQKEMVIYLDSVLDFALRLDERLELNRPLGNLRPLALSPTHSGKLELALKFIGDFKSARLVKDSRLAVIEEKLQVLERVTEHAISRSHQEGLNRNIKTLVSWNERHRGCREGCRVWRGG